MFIDCVKILAVGSRRRFAWFITDDGYDFCVYISDTTYKLLKSMGVPTSQKIYRENGKLKK